MTTERTKEIMAVMDAFTRGEAVQFKSKNTGWMDTVNPFWDWANYEYRIKPKGISLDEFKKLMETEAAGRLNSTPFLDPANEINVSIMYMQMVKDMVRIFRCYEEDYAKAKALFEKILDIYKKRIAEYVIDTDFVGNHRHPNPFNNDTLLNIIYNFLNPADIEGGLNPVWWNPDDLGRFLQDAGVRRLSRLVDQSADETDM